MTTKPRGFSIQIVTNVLANWMSYVVTILVGLFMSPFLIHHLGDSNYGAWLLIGSLISYLNLLDLGFSPSIVKHVSEYRARDEHNAINGIVSNGLLLYTLLGVVSGSICCLFAFFFNRLFHTPLDNRTAALMVEIVGLDLAISLPASVFTAVLRGYQRYDVCSAITSCTMLMRSALLVVLLSHGHGLLTLAILTFAFDMVRIAYSVYVAFRLVPELRLVPASIQPRVLRYLFGHSVHFFLIGVGNQLNFCTDSIVIGMFLSTVSVTAYFIAARLTTYLRELVIEMMGVLMPAVSDLHAKQGADKVHQLHIVSTKYTLLIALPVAAVFFVQGNTFITLWVGHNFGGSFFLLRLLTVGILANLIVGPTERVLTGIGEHRIVARITIVQAATNLLLSLFLVKPFGLTGVALGTTLSMLAFALFALPFYFRAYLRRPLGPYIRQAMVLPLIVQIPFVAMLFGFKSLVRPTSLASFFGLLFLAFIPYAALVFTRCMSSRERDAFLHVAGRFRLKLAPQYS